LGWRLGPGKGGQNTPTCDQPLKEPQTQNWKFFSRS